MLLRTGLLAITFLLMRPATAAESYDNCTGFIDSLPAEISTQGTWCLRKDLATAVGQGRALRVSTSNVTIDCNDFKLGNLQAGTDTLAYGIYSTGTFNVSVRNCTVLGFKGGIYLSAYPAGGNYRVEDNRVRGATWTGIFVDGTGSVRSNVVSDIGGTTWPGEPDRAMGILAGGAIDVRDNAISHVEGAVGAVGLYMNHPWGASVVGNRIRQVVSAGPEGAYGIKTFASGGMLVRENDILAVGGQVGIACSIGWDRVRDNTIVGFTSAMEACGDAGGNDISP